MKFIIILFTIIGLSSQLPELSEVRVAYKEAAQNKTKVNSFNDLLINITKEDKVSLIAYKGAALTLVAKYAATIKEKKAGFIEGVSYIEYAIEKNPNAIEPRFVRLGVQENSPKILKYKNNIKEDKLFLIKQFKNISSSDLKNHIKDYILQSKVFTDEEKSVISSQ